MSDIRDAVEGWAHTAINLWERVYRVLKGLPHHRLALISVGVGGAILTGPLWEPYLRAIVEKSFDVKIDVPAGPAWGVLLVALGLVYHLLMTWIASRENAESATRETQLVERTRSHDAPIFHRFLGQAPEYAFKKVIGDITNDHAYTSIQSTLLNNTYYFLDTVGNKFNDEIVNEKATVLEHSLDELTDFLAEHFSVFGPVLNGGILRFCMEPQWNIDRGGYPTGEEYKKYHDLAKTLSQITSATVAAYDDLLRTGHKRLL